MFVSLVGNVDANCNYIGNPDFNPDVQNIMSYAPPICLVHFTLGQMERIHSSVLTSYVLVARSYQPEISGSTLLCLKKYLMLHRTIGILMGY